MTQYGNGKVLLLKAGEGKKRIFMEKQSEI